jgi:RNA polymerase sigma-70 factor (ECF subfamily)
MEEVTDLRARRDRHLVSRVAVGDEDAFVELFRLYGPAALGLALRVVGDQALAEEVAQEVFLSAWRKTERYDAARGSVRSWLLVQVHHRAVDVVRREEAERRRTTTNLEPLGSERDVEDVVEEAWLQDRRGEVRRALQALPEDQRTVIELAYFEGLTQAQVASRLGVPLGTVKSRTLAAMRRLRNTLGFGQVES